MADLFQSASKKAPGSQSGYSAKDIEVLEGLEPVRRRPGMYIGGSDEHAMHHLVAEVLDNSMDAAVAGHADRKRGVSGRSASVRGDRGGCRNIKTKTYPTFSLICLQL